MRIVLTVLLLLAVSPAWAQTAPPKAVLAAAVDGVIRPGMADFASEAKALDAAMTQLCAAPSATAVLAATQAFGQAAEAYGRIEFIRIGPLMDDNRADRLLFFPDRKGIGLKQVQAILAGEDADATVVETLRSKSIAVQGFGALEFVLFGTGAEVLAQGDGAFRCRFGTAIAGNIAQIAGELEAGWTAPDGVAEHLMVPSADYADYRTPIEALEEVVGLVSHGIEAVRDTRINPFVANADASAKPKQALFWRSGLTMAMIGANVEGMRTLIDVSGVAREVEEKDKALDNSIAFEFANAKRAIDLVTLPVAEAVVDPKQAQALKYLVLVTGSLQALVGEQLSAALGLSVGFSSLDGD